MKTFSAAIKELVTNDRIAKGMSNEELADAILRGVWSQFDISGKESALLDEAMKRLKGIGD